MDWNKKTHFKYKRYDMTIQGKNFIKNDFLLLLKIKIYIGIYTNENLRNTNHFATIVVTINSNTNHQKKPSLGQKSDESIFS